MHICVTLPLRVKSDRWQARPYTYPKIASTLLWRHNGHDGVSNHRPRDCLLNRLFRRIQRKHQSSATLACVWGIHRWSVNSPHKGPVTRKMFPFDGVIMWCAGIFRWRCYMVIWQPRYTDSGSCFVRLRLLRLFHGPCVTVKLLGYGAGWNILAGIYMAPWPIIDNIQRYQFTDFISSLLTSICL